MADRYWVGGAGTWDATTTTNWSASSGGAGGASAPTSADNVIFNSASNATAYAVTVGTNANAADITIAGPAVGNVTITSAATSVINCYGSWLNSATGVVFTTTTGATINFLATTTGKTVTTNNVTLGAMTVTFNGVGGGWTLGSAFTHTQVITVTAGSFDTGNFAVNSGGFSSSNSNIRTVTLGSSTLTITGTAAWTFTTTTNLTFSAGTSTITCSGASPTFAGGALTYSTVSFTSTSSGTTTITGANTFTTLSQATVASAAIRVVSIGADQTVSGTLTLSNGAAANRRMFVRSDTIGTSRTLTVATLAALVDVDFRDIIAAGASAASPWTGTRLGNCRNNTNITFDAGVNKYWSTAAGASASWSGTAWATSSGGTAAVNNFPLAQDTCIIDDAGATTGDGLRTGNTVTIDANWNMGTLNFSGRTVAFNWTQSVQDPVIYGNVTLTSSMTMTTVSGSPSWTFAGAGLTQTLDSAGITIRLNSFTVNSLGGTVSLARDATFELNATPDGNVTLTQGTLSLGSFTLTTVVFSSSASTTRTLAFGTGKIVLTGNNTSIWSTSTGTALTVTGSKRVELSYSGSTGTRTIQGSTNATAIEGTNLLNYFVTAGSDIVAFSASRNYETVDFSNGGTSTFTGTWINATATTNVYGNLILNSAMVVGSGAEIISMKATSGTKTITSAGQTIDFPLTISGLGGTFACSDALTLGATRALTMVDGTLQLAAGTTNTVGSFVTTGTTMKYLQSTIPGTQATISQASGTVTATYLSVQDSNATGGATWNATDPTNVYVTNNTGWNFGTLAALSGVAATGAVGFLIPSFNVGVTGVQATGSAGSVGFANAYNLSGVQATGEVGNVYTGWYVIPTNQTPSWTNIIQS
jgi:hypothetical protein